MRNFLTMEIFLRLVGWRSEATFEEGRSIPEKYSAFIFLPVTSLLLLDSIAAVQETFTPNKYLLGIFSRSVPGSILPFVTFSNRGLCFHFISADFSLIWRNFSNWIIPGLICLSFQRLGNCTLNWAGFKGALSLALFKDTEMMYFHSSSQLSWGKSASKKT